MVVFLDLSHASLFIQLTVFDLFKRYYISDCDLKYHFMHLTILYFYFIFA